MNLSFTVAEIAAVIAPERRVDGPGAPAAAITGVAALEEAQPGDLSFLGNEKYIARVADSAAGVILLPLNYEGQPKPGQSYFFVADPSSTLARICAAVEAKLWPRPAPGIHSTAIIDPSAKLGSGLHIGPYCIIEADATIGDGSILEAANHIGRGAKLGADNWLKPRATVSDYCETGARVKLFVGALIGGDGFGFEFVKGAYQKIPQIGNVVLEDDVEVGANSTIDRARFATTRIGEGTKIDNLVQIGHNCRVGKHCILVSQVGLAGSTVLEDYVVLAGQAGLAGHLRIGRGAQIGAQCGVMADVPAGARMLDSPALPVKTALRLMSYKTRLPDLFKRVGAIEEQLGLGSKGTK
jgi:UDP-3-O-[3-hydroxymyristoyl] glucosamine N-acyltransferase